MTGEVLSGCAVRAELQKERAAELEAPMPIMLPHDRAEVAALRVLGIEVLGAPLPWKIIAPHAKQAWANHGQTLERLRERGGLDATEAVAVLEDRAWHPMDLAAAFARLTELVRAAK